MSQIGFQAAKLSTQDLQFQELHNSINEMRQTIVMNKAASNTQHWTKSKEVDDEYKNTIGTLLHRLQAAEDDLRNVELYSLSKDPVCLLRINFQAVIDRSHEILFIAATGLVPDKHLHNVKNWVATSLNPITYKKPPVPDIRTWEQQAADRAILDDQWFKVCQGLLSSKDTLLPEYQELIRSGTLRFLMQSCNDLRNQANVKKFEALGGIDGSYAHIPKKVWEVGRGRLVTKVRSSAPQPQLEGLLLAMMKDKLASIKAAREDDEGSGVGDGDADDEKHAWQKKQQAMYDSDNSDEEEEVGV
ncbi:hypothetical protein HYPSUDRAFT_209021 [Hypholoma sublateritium FD-334 SS-4]|uniref:Uncharacterized protein n=1 Tax=Hypholoma sublateritium (strain FD-334 SS-4) TaxID=945553 RepID=A0A0D2KHK2_HYPSF|nr:hypothetical protein HYPSUDRAFT_209021 [Hypholoma sublateritium FD-334 SS-4]